MNTPAAPAAFSTLSLCFSTSFCVHSRRPTFTLSSAPACSLFPGVHTCGEVHAVGRAGSEKWMEKGKRRSCVLYFNGLWRNLPVRLELGEEEPVGCGTLDKGDIYTLTLDHYSARRSRQLETIFNSWNTLLCFGKLVKKKKKILSAVWIRM